MSAKKLYTLSVLPLVLSLLLTPLPGQTLVCPGHGKTSTIAGETAANPFLKK